MHHSTSIYKKPTHTDQCLAFKCSYDRSKHFLTKLLVIFQEKKHLSSVLVSKGCPNSFVKNITKTKTQKAGKEPAYKINSTALRLCLQQQDNGPLLSLTENLAPKRPNDAVDRKEQDGVVFKIPCECGKELEKLEE